MTIQVNPNGGIQMKQMNYVYPFPLPPNQFVAQGVPVQGYATQYSAGAPVGPHNNNSSSPPPNTMQPYPVYATTPHLNGNNPSPPMNTNPNAAIVVDKNKMVMF
jgi:hypothetical protein